MAALLYMEDLVYPPFLKAIEKKMAGIHRDGVLDSGVLEQLTADVWYSPFPQYQVTERPDRAAQALLNGRVVVVTDNSPEALILPTTLNTLFQTSDDAYRHFAIVSFLRLIRYAGGFSGAGSAGALCGGDDASSGNPSDEPDSGAEKSQGGSALSQCAGSADSGAGL